MNALPLLADVTWLRLAVVGLDILAVVLVVRLWSAVAAWWDTAHISRPMPAAIRVARAGPRRH
jgi:hypothetical protein